MTDLKSCGAVVFTRINGEIRYVLVQSQEGVYGFPKGCCEPGETEEETALREIYEEVNLSPVLVDGFRITEEYRIRKKGNILKTVVYFLAEYSGQSITAQETEIIRYSVVPYGEALARLSYEGRKNVLRNANAYLTGKQI